MDTEPARSDRRSEEGYIKPTSKQAGRDSRRPGPSLATTIFPSHSPFISLSDDIIAAMRRIAVRRQFVNGQAIHLQDDDARFLNVIVAGHVRLSYAMEDGSSVLHAVLPSGETFGELGVFIESTYPDMATAAGPVALVSLPCAGLLDLARAHPTLSDALIRAVATRHREYLVLVRDLSLPSLSARLARTLIRLADRLDAHAEHDPRPTQVIGALVTQTDLGLMARGSRGNVNRALRTWQRAGWIARKERSIVILNRPALAAVTADL